MRRKQHIGQEPQGVVVRQRLRFGHINGGEESARLQGEAERLGIHQATTRRVQKYRAILQEGQLGSPDHALCGGDVRGMERNNLAGLEERRQVGSFDFLALRLLLGQVRVIHQNTTSKGAQKVAKVPPCVSKANQTNRLTKQ